MRWRILALLAVISGLTYLDRLNLAIVGKHLQDEFAFGTETMGWILSGFVLGYALFQVPGGWMGDRFGPRGVLTGAILFWSLFTALTPLAPRFPLRDWIGLAATFFLVRFLVGVGEAMAFPNTNHLVGWWMSPKERATGNSLWIFGVGVGGVVTPLFVTWMTVQWGWRAAFYVCALVGVVVALAWHLYATNRPEEHPHVNAAELALIRAPQDRSGQPREEDASSASPPWRRILRSASAWGLILSYFCIAYPAYIFYTWFPIYLVRVRGLTVVQGGVWAAAPFLAIMVLALLGGWVSDRAIRRLGRRRGRQAAVWLGVTTSATLMYAGGNTENNTLAIVLLACASGFNIFATVNWWATCNDIAPRFSGSLAGLMNMSGNLGGWLSPIFTGMIATRVGWIEALDFAALVTLAAGALWIPVNAAQRVDD
jgi:ACS family glucarate transporter-like MFS transporter